MFEFTSTHEVPLRFHGVRSIRIGGILLNECVSLDSTVTLPTYCERSPCSLSAKWVRE